jgi:hypothetical protein
MPPVILLENFTTFGQAVSIARSELGVEIEIDLSDLVPDKETNLAPVGHVLGRFSYPDEGEKTGRLLYVRNVVPKDASQDLVAYLKVDSKFPHHSTVDQFFNDQKFEEYRGLGRYVTAAAISQYPF